MTTFAVSLLLSALFLKNAAVSGGSPDPVDAETSNRFLRVMTFNIWLCGNAVENGIEKIANHIRLVDADIVALQEVQPECVDKILEELKGNYVVAVNETFFNVGVLTRHQIVDKKLEIASEAAVGVQIKLESSGQLINFWSLHLEFSKYGPYKAYNKLATELSQVTYGEQFDQHSRVANVLDLLSNEAFKEAVRNSTVPLIVCGDFNSPSHLDWIESTKHLHGDWVVEWPATKLLQEGTDLVDTFREMHPDPLEEPGNTWSTVVKKSDDSDYSIQEPQDRIDFVLKKGEQLTTTDSFMYSGTEQLEHKPNHMKNDWPSDHFAVVTEFSIN